MSVVGTGVETPLGNEDFGSAVLVTPAGLERFARAQPFAETLVRAAQPGDVDDLVAEYGSRYELTDQLRPREVDNLRQLDRLPAILGGFLAVVGLAALANAIVLAVRRRRHDLAVLRVIGYTSRQTAAAVLTMALVAGAFALAIAYLWASPPGAFCGGSSPEAPRWKATRRSPSGGRSRSAPECSLPVCSSPCSRPGGRRR